jgi:chromosome segregation ATPase
MDFKETLGAIVAGVSLLLPAIKWLINDWAKKAEEIEARKEKYTDKALNRLQDDVKEFRATISSIQATIKDLQISLAASKSEMEYLKEHLKTTAKSLDQLLRDFDTKLSNKVKTELIELSKRVAMVRDKKDGK